MPVPSRTVGHQTDPITHTVDARWLMSYAAGLGESDPAYFDTTRPMGVVAHPLFPVCIEWPTVLALRALEALTEEVTADETRRGIHATHDCVLIRPIQAGDVLTTVATVIGVERRQPGAFLTMDMVTTDGNGAVVCRTRQGSLYLATDVSGPDRPAPAEDPLPALPAAPIATEHVQLSSTAAHVYTECARIWNPIHTDLAVASAANLPGLILHGTATLAHAVSAAVRHLGGGDPLSVTRIRGRFAAMVPMACTLSVRVFANGRFEVCTEDGATAVRDGHVHLQ